MDSSPLWFTVLAIVASVLSAGGIVSQVLAWKRERDKAALDLRKTEVGVEAEKTKAVVAAKVEIAKVEVEHAKVDAADAKDEREHTGRFTTTLLERVEKLEGQHDANQTRITALEGSNKELVEANLECAQSNLELKTSYGELDRAHRALVGEHASLKADHETLKQHVAKVEIDNLGLRSRLARLDREAGITAAVEHDVIETGARSARGAASKQGENR